MQSHRRGESIEINGKLLSPRDAIRLAIHVLHAATVHPDSPISLYDENPVTDPPDLSYDEALPAFEIINRDGMVSFDGEELPSDRHCIDVMHLLMAVYGKPAASLACHRWQITRQDESVAPHPWPGARDASLKPLLPASSPDLEHSPCSCKTETGRTSPGAST